jgi:hypothetical protein
MPLLTRTPTPADRVADVRDRALDASRQVAARARDVGDDVTEHAHDAALAAREAAAPVVERAREASDRRIMPLIGQIFRRLMQLAAFGGSIAARVLVVISRVLGSLASESERLADETARRVDVPSPARSSRWARRRRATLIFAGGFAAGTATGYGIAELRRRSLEEAAADDRWPAPVPTPVPTPATTSRPASG